MKHISIDGVECLTLPDVAAMAGLTVEAVRRRRIRGTLELNPHLTIGKQTFYAADDVREALRKGLSR